jgi:hypothetical protein
MSHLSIYKTIKDVRRKKKEEEEEEDVRNCNF